MKYIAILICLFFLGCSNDYERFHEEKNLEITRILCENQIVVNNEWLLEISNGKFDDTSGYDLPIKMSTLKHQDGEYINKTTVSFGGGKYYDCQIIGVIPRVKDGTNVVKNLKNRK